jgi:uncharacterized DUF497 family protein
MNISISPAVLAKLAGKHGVAASEVQECFLNRDGGFLEDTREQHRSVPPTQWFIAATNESRMLKVVFMLRRTGRVARCEIRTAYEPNAEEVRIYRKYGQGRLQADSQET